MIKFGNDIVTVGGFWLGISSSPTDRVFAFCGVDGEGHYASPQAQAERSQIPTTWGGDMVINS